MRTIQTWCKIFLAFGVMVFGAVDDSAAETPASTAVRFRLLAKSVIVVPVFINGRGGRGPFDFVLDTGTDTSLIDLELAHELGLTAVDRLTLYTASGEKNLLRTFLPQISLGGLSKTKLEVLEDRLNGAFGSDRKIRGILGQNFLSQFDLLLDYKHGTVQLFSSDDKDTLADGPYVPLTFQHGRPILKARSQDGSELLLQLDSGTSTLTIFKAGTPGFQSCSLPMCNGVMRTAVATSQITQGVLSALCVGDLRLRNVPAVFSEQKPMDDPVDGLLPTHLFSTVYINNREGYAIFGYDPR